jgi:hypothetical protein
VLLTVPLAAMWSLSKREPMARLAELAFIFLPTAAFLGVAGLARGFAIDYGDPLWVVWPVFNVALLALLTLATLSVSASMATPEGTSAEEPSRRGSDVLAVSTSATPHIHTLSTLRASGPTT